MRNPEALIEFHLASQPTDTSCGPTCLEGLYRFWGHRAELGRLLNEIPQMPTGGTLAVYLGSHALREGFRAKLYTYNLQVFDPTWFQQPEQLADKLRESLPHRTKPRLRQAVKAYLEFVELGGEVLLEDLSPGLIRKYLRRRIPMLTGLSSTFLYRSCREVPDTNKEDDLRGRPGGHFVLISGYDPETKEVLVRDPYNSGEAQGRSYPVSITRLINAILLGVLTYDANLLVLQPNSSSSTLP